MHNLLLRYSVIFRMFPQNSQLISIRLTEIFHLLTKISVWTGVSRQLIQAFDLFHNPHIILTKYGGNFWTLLTVNLREQIARSRTFLREQTFTHAYSSSQPCVEVTWILTVTVKRTWLHNAGERICWFFYMHYYHCSQKKLLEQNKKAVFNRRFLKQRSDTEANKNELNKAVLSMCNVPFKTLVVVSLFPDGNTML